MSERKTITISKKDLDKDNFYTGLIEEESNVNVEIEENLGEVNFRNPLSVHGYIIARDGTGIHAGYEISAGGEITAGLAIKCNGILKFGYRLFSGIAIWRGSITDEEKTITCGELEADKSQICYGILKETGIEKNPKKKTTLELTDEQLEEIKKIIK